MAYDYERLQRLPVDPRIADRISRSPKMSAEQGAGYLASYGGGGQYMTFAKLPTNQRLAYAAVLEGHTDPSEIAVVTGLSVTDVNVALSSLGKRGIIEVQEAPAPI